MDYGLFQITYMSRAVEKPDVPAITRTSEANNSRDGITGLLVCDNLRFLQVIEGPRKLVEACLDRIVADKRHDHIEVLSRQEVAQNNFDTFRVRCRIDGKGDPRLFLDQIKAEVAKIQNPNLQALFIGFAFMAPLSRR